MDNLESTEEVSLNEATSSVSNEGNQIIDDTECDNAISSTTPDKLPELPTSLRNEVVIDDTSLTTEPEFLTAQIIKTDENVDDIVQDLENLLGESNDSYRINRENYGSTSKASSSVVVEDTSLFEEEANLTEVLINAANESKLNTIDDELSSNIIESEETDIIVSEKSTNELIEAVEEEGNVATSSLVEPEEPLQLTSEDDAEPKESISEVTTNQIGQIDEISLEDTENKNYEEHDETVEEITTNVSDEKSVEPIQEVSVSQNVEVCDESVGEVTTYQSDEKPDESIEEVTTNEDVEQPVGCVEEVTTNEDIEQPVGCVKEVTSANTSDVEPEEIVSEITKREDSEQSQEIIEVSTNQLEETVDEVTTNEAEPQLIESDEEPETVEEELSFADYYEKEAEPDSNVVSNSDHREGNEVVIVQNESEVEEIVSSNIEDVIVEASDDDDKAQEVCNVVESSTTEFPSVSTRELVQESNEASEQREAVSEVISSSSEVQDVEKDEEVVSESNLEVVERESAVSEEINEVDSSNNLEHPYKSPERVELGKGDLDSRQEELNQPLSVQVDDGDSFKMEDENAEVSTVTESESELSSTDVSGNSDASRAPLIMTIAKHKFNNTHSILKVYDPNEATVEPVEVLKPREEPTVPKITIKPVINPNKASHSPRLTIKPIKPPDASDKVKPCGSGSPRTTLKSVVAPISPLKMTIKSYPKERQCSPKLTIKPIVKPEEETFHHSPKITIKPIVKPEEVESHSEIGISKICMKPMSDLQDEFSSEEIVHSPRITIKPIIKPDELEDAPVQPFKLNIKPVVKPETKIIIKPIPKPEDSGELIDFEDQIKQERIVLKIPKNKKEKTSPSTDTEKLKTIKLKFSTEGGLTHIVPVTQGVKRSSSEETESVAKHVKSESSDLTVSLVSNSGISPSTSSDLVVCKVEESDNVPAVISDNQACGLDVSITPADNSGGAVVKEEVQDPLSEIPIFEISLNNSVPTTDVPPVVIPPAPRKRGRPRKVPLVVREEFKDPKDLEAPCSSSSEESSRPKRSCRGATARTTLGMKPRKPRGPSTRGGRGGKRNVCNRLASKRGKERRPYGSRKRELAELMLKDPTYDPRNGDFKPIPLPGDLSLYEEETRMSADNSSRAHTPAKQVFGPPGEFDESQSSIQSNTTTESGEKIQKSRRGGPRLEVHQEPEGEVISADKLAEYSWGGGGPYMLQEQVAQFLGIKSFKRKYPGIQRRPVDMQERDFIRESCLASEAMCDMGLTAVKSEDILDIMYTDFQHKYEEYCKHQRDRQAKDVSNKQKALSLAASQEKNKLNIVEQAIQSAYQWNASFNKTRKEERKACMDLQTFTVHFPKGKMKQVNKPPVGNYPIAVVPGQFTDYYKSYTPDELNGLPLNSLGSKPINYGNQDTEESQSDDSGSDSDSSSSDSDSTCSGSSDAENCKKCAPLPTNRKVLAR